MTSPLHHPDLTNPIPFISPPSETQNDQRPFTLSLIVDRTRAGWQPIPITSNRRNLCASNLNFCATSPGLVAISSSPALQIAPLNRP
ncbi:putative dolichyldiphosphatase [Fusarium oxysporum f. sp. albedinis]|nr:putative dolichyldiphosphatase [Fusarium oxysporum f. sp. albedinis]